MTRGPQARASPRDDPRGPDWLRFERVDGRLRDLLSDASLGQVVPNQGVAGSSLGQELGTAARNALVVYGSNPNQVVQGFPAGGRSDLSSREPLGKFLLTQIARRERAGSLRHRLVPDELATHPARPIAIELNAHVQSRGQHSLGRQRPPVLPFQGDFDAPARSPEKGANPWRRPLR